MSDFISREAAIAAAMKGWAFCGSIQDAERHFEDNNAVLRVFAALRALPPAQEAAPAVKVKVKVKPLVWVSHPYGLIAGASWGEAYIINTKGRGVLVIKGLPFNPEFDSVEAAKAAAQADYDARILAALEGAEA